MSKQIVSAGVPGYDISTFSWFLTNVCQYRCDYCSVLTTLPLVNKFDQKYVNVYKTILKLLKFPGLGKYKMEIQGGEPTQHPDIKHIVQTLSEYKNCVEVEIITNLVNSIEMYQSLDFGPHVRLTTSFHPQYHDIDEYFQKIYTLNNTTDLNIEPNINISDQQKFWPKTKELMARFIDAGLPYGINFLFDVGHYTPEYTESVHQEFKTEIEQSFTDESEGSKIPYKYSDDTQEEYNTYEISKSNLYKFYGYKCTPKYWVINYDGTITNSCTGDHLDILKKNYNKCVNCPVETGCGEVEKFLYHKTLA